MKTRIRFTAIALLGSAMVFTSNADKVKLDQLPIEVRDKIQTHTGSAQIEDIDRQTKGGTTTYEVAFKQNGQHTELLFNERGELVTQDGQTALDSGKIDYKEAPEAVRKIADTRLKGAEVNDVDRIVKDGQVTYEIGFKQNGQQKELLVSHDGRILRDTGLPKAVGAPAPRVIGKSANPPSSALPEPVTLSTSRKIELSEAPAAVQRAITSAAKGARIEDLERGTWQGQDVYEAAFKDNGRHIELQVRADGAILHDPRNVTPASRRPIRWSADSPYGSVTSPVQLSSAEKVERSSLPAAVQRRLTRDVGSRIEDIDRGTWQGKTIYEVGFKDEKGQHVELQIDENGTIVYDPRTRR